MKFFAVLPLALLAASCYYAQPYDPGYPPYYGRPQAPGPRAPYGETGDYEPIPPGRGPETRPAPPRDTPPAPNPPQGRPSHPVAERTDKPNQVISPFPPYNVIDVSDFRSGQLAKDPSNGKIFVVP